MGVKGVGDINKQLPLVPHRFKIAGYLLCISGFILSILRFYYGLKLKLFETKVFAVYSSYLQTKFFSIIDNNITEEIAGLLLVAGFTLVVCSREKIEDEKTADIRLRSFVVTVYANAIFMLLSILFVFGLAFVHILIAHVFSFFIFYIVIFTILIHRRARGDCRE